MPPSGCFACRSDLLNGSLFAAIGVTAGMHLTEVRRDAFTRAGCVPYKQLRLGAKVKVGGLVADEVRRPLAAKGSAFIRLEDPDRIMDIIPELVYLEHREACHSALLVVEGVLRQQYLTVAVVTRKVMLKLHH